MVDHPEDVELSLRAALMAVLVVVGMQDLVLMLALAAAVMAWQKHARYGVIVARIAGIAMILGGGIVALA